MKRAVIGWGITFSILCCCSVAFSASREQKLVTRVETVTVTFKHGTLAIKATGMARTPATMDRGGQLVRRGAQATLNKEGLLEYNMVFPAVANYGGFKLKPIAARLQSIVPPDPFRARSGNVCARQHVLNHLRVDRKSVV